MKLKPAIAQDMVIIPDPNLEKVIRAEDIIVNKKAITESYITKADLESITYLRGRGKHISDLSGLEYCINLEGLVLSYNDITSLIALEGLVKLKRLNLSNNEIDDLQNLEGLFNLEELRLSNNNIDNIDILVNLPKLKLLDLSRNNISDISVLSILTDLEEVIIGHNNISNITPLVDNPRVSSIDVIDLTGNPLDEKTYTLQLPELQKKVRLVFYDEQSEEIISHNHFPSYWWWVIGIGIAVAVIIVPTLIIRKR